MNCCISDIRVKNFPVHKFNYLCIKIKGYDHRIPCGILERLRADRLGTRREAGTLRQVRAPAAGTEGPVGPVAPRERVEAPEPRGLPPRRRLRQGRQGGQRHLGEGPQDGRPVEHRLQRRAGPGDPCGLGPAHRPAPRSHLLQARGRVPRAGAQLGIHLPGNPAPGTHLQGERDGRAQGAEPRAPTSRTSTPCARSSPGRARTWSAAAWTACAGWWKTP